MIEFLCTQFDHTAIVKDEHVGKKVQCLTCKTVGSIPIDHRTGLFLLLVWIMAATLVATSGCDKKDSSHPPTPPPSLNPAEEVKKNPAKAYETFCGHVVDALEAAMANSGGKIASPPPSFELQGTTSLTTPYVGTLSIHFTIPGEAADSTLDYETLNYTIVWQDEHWVAKNIEGQWSGMNKLAWRSFRSVKNP